MKSSMAVCIALLFVLSCGGRPATDEGANLKAGQDVGKMVVGEWSRVGKECDGTGQNCQATTVDEGAMVWRLSADGTGLVTDRRPGRSLNLAITYTVIGNVLTEKDVKGNVFVNSVITVNDKFLVIDQPFQGRRIVNKYEKQQ